MTDLGGSVGCVFHWRPGGWGFNPRRGRHHSFVEIDHEIFSTIILSLSLIQEGQLSVSGKIMCTILVNRLEDLNRRANSLNLSGNQVRSSCPLVEDIGLIANKHLDLTCGCRNWSRVSSFILEICSISNAMIYQTIFVMVLYHNIHGWYQYSSRKHTYIILTPLNPTFI